MHSSKVMSQFRTIKDVKCCNNDGCLVMSKSGLDMWKLDSLEKVADEFTCLIIKN